DGAGREDLLHLWASRLDRLRATAGAHRRNRPARGLRGAGWAALAEPLRPRRALSGAGRGATHRFASARAPRAGRLDLQRRRFRPGRGALFPRRSSLRCRRARGAFGNRRLRAGHADLALRGNLLRRTAGHAARPGGDRADGPARRGAGSSPGRGRALRGTRGLGAYHRGALRSVLPFPRLARRRPLPSRAGARLRNGPGSRPRRAGALPLLALGRPLRDRSLLQLRPLRPPLARALRSAAVAGEGALSARAGGAARGVGLRRVLAQVPRDGRDLRRRASCAPGLHRLAERLAWRLLRRAAPALAGDAAAFASARPLARRSHREKTAGRSRLRVRFAGLLRRAVALRRRRALSYPPRATPRCARGVSRRL